MNFEELTHVALVGTGRASLTLSAEDDPARERALASVRSDPAEQQLLGAAAVLSAYEICGAEPPQQAMTLTKAPADQLPACSRKSAATQVR